MYINKYQKENIILYQGNCFDIIPNHIEDNSINLIFLDLPYNITACEWDQAELDIDRLFANLKRILKPDGAVVATATFAFGARLIAQKSIKFRYDLVYAKTSGTGFLNANKMPLRSHENILVFYNKLPCYNPQRYAPYDRRKGSVQAAPTPSKEVSNIAHVYSTCGIKTSHAYEHTRLRSPGSIITFQNRFGQCSYHPTMKPYNLYLWLLRSYSNPGDTIFDPTMGCGLLGRVCLDNDRAFIGCELDEKYFNTAVDLQAKDIKAIKSNKISNIPYSINPEYNKEVYNVDNINKFKEDT